MRLAVYFTLTYQSSMQALILNSFWVVCLLVAPLVYGNSYMWQDLVPPSSNDVIAFSNDKPPATGSINKVEESRIREHLEKGAVFYSRKALSDFVKEQNLHDVEIFDRETWGRSGTIATKDHRIIYWSLMSDHVLRLETAEVEQCFLLYLDEWTQKRVDALKEYQYSNQAGYKRYTPTLDERIQSYESSLKSIRQTIERYETSLRELYPKYLSAVGEEKRALANAVVSQRRLLTNVLKRRSEMEIKLQPLQLEAKYLVLEDGS